MGNLTTLQETQRTPLDGTEWVRVATSGANWRAQLGTQTWVFGGAVVGDTTGSTSLQGTASTFQIAQSSGNWAETILEYGNTGNTPVLMFAKTRASTPGGNTILNSSDGVGVIKFIGNDGTGNFDICSISAGLDGAPAAGSLPGVLRLNTSGGGTTSLVERLAINNGGNVLIGGFGDFFGTRLSVAGITSAVSSITQAEFSNDATSAQHIFIKSRNATIGSHTVVQNNDPLGMIIFKGDDGTNNIAAAQIHTTVDGTPGTNDMPGALHFSTTPDGAAAVIERMSIGQAGDITIGGAGYSPGDSYVKITSNSAHAVCRFDQYTVDTTPCFIIMDKSRSGLFGNGIVNNNDGIAQFIFSGNDGTGMVQAALISIEVDGTPGVGDMPGRMRFFTTPDGSNSPVERMRIDNAGNVNIANGGAITNTLFSVTPIFQVSAVNRSNYESAFHHYENNSNGPTINLAKSRSTTLGGFALVSNADSAGVIQFGATDGSAIQRAAYIQCLIEGTPAANNMPGVLSFAVTTSSTTAEWLRIQSAGRIITQGQTDSMQYSQSFPWLHLPGTGNDTSGMGISRFANDAGGATISIAHSRNTSRNSHTIVQNGDLLGGVYFDGSDGSTFRNAAAITGNVDGTPGASDMPGSLLFLTTPDGTATGVERMRISNSGTITINNGAVSTTTAPFQVIQNNSSAPTIANFFAVSNDQFASSLNLIKWRGSGGGAVQNNDQIGIITFSGSDGTNSLNMAAIYCFCDATPGTNDAPGRLAFYTTADGASSVTERMRIDNAGRVIISTTATATLAVGGNDNQVQHWGGSVAGGGLSLGMFNATAATCSHIDFYRSDNATIGSATVVASGDALGKISWYGAQQTGTFATQNKAAEIRVEVDGTVTSGAGADMPGRLMFLTTPDGSGTPAENMRIAASGAVYFPGVGTTAGGGSGARLDNATTPANSLLRDTSSLRYKTAVSEIPAERIMAIDALRAIEFASLASADDPNARFVGFAAEEVAAIDPVLVSYDAQGRPDSVMYDRVLLMQVQALMRRVQQLEQTVH